MRAAVLLAVVITFGVAAAHAQTFDGRQTVEQFWISKGVPEQVAQGIADRVGKESSFNPMATGDGGSSMGLYMHHNDRMKTLLATMENDQAWREVMGDDPIAAAHWGEIKMAPDRAAANRLWTKYFERPRTVLVRELPSTPTFHPAPQSPTPTIISDPFLHPETMAADSTFAVEGRR